MSKSEKLIHYTILVDDYEFSYLWGKMKFPRFQEEEYEDLDEINYVTVIGHIAKESDDKKVPKGYKVAFDIRPNYVFGKHNTDIEYWGIGERSRKTETLRLSMEVPKDSYANILEMLAADKVKVISITALSLKYNRTRVRSISLYTYMDPEDY